MVCQIKRRDRVRWCERVGGEAHGVEVVDASSVRCDQPLCITQERAAHGEDIERFVARYKWIVESLASDLERPMGLSREELVQYGYIGLLQAYHRHKPSELKTSFLWKWVRGAIFDGKRKNEIGSRRGERVEWVAFDELDHASWSAAPQGIELAYEARDVEARLSAALAILEPHERLLIESHDLQGQSLRSLVPRLQRDASRLSHQRKQALEKMRIFLEQNPDL